MKADMVQALWVQALQALHSKIHGKTKLRGSKQMVLSIYP